MTIPLADPDPAPTLSRRFFRASESQWDDWRWQQANRLTGESGLDRIPFLTPPEREELGRVVRVFPWAVTPYFLSRIAWEDPKDPLRRQVLPHKDEIRTPATGRRDPLEEEAHTVAPGLIRRYPDRAVLLATARCAVLCRYCFRKRLWDTHAQAEAPDRWEPALRYLRTHRSIRDVLVSGGDPLTLSDQALDRLLGSLRHIPHVELIRVGTRVPVVLPQRVTDDLCRVLDRHGPVWVVTQFNHPQEITSRAAEACQKLTRAGMPVNNQTVLLKGVNDSPALQHSLCRNLLRIRVRPYYLHQCDRVLGAEHFRTPLQAGIDIVEQMQGTLSGLAIPRFVVDLPGSGGKVPLRPGHLIGSEGSRVLIRSRDGRTVLYENP